MLNTNVSGSDWSDHFPIAATHVYVEHEFPHVSALGICIFIMSTYYNNDLQTHLDLGVDTGRGATTCLGGCFLSISWFLYTLLTDPFTSIL